jgi:hypothetical protein
VAHPSHYKLSKPLEEPLIITLTGQLIKPVKVDKVVSDTSRADSCQTGREKLWIFPTPLIVIKSIIFWEVLAEYLCEVTGQILFKYR